MMISLEYSNDPPSISHALSIIDEYIETLVVEQDYLCSEGRWNKLVRCLPKRYLIIIIIIIIFSTIFKDIRSSYRKIGKLEMKHHGQDGNEWSQY